MPRRSKILYSEPNEWFPCPVLGCSRKFRTQTGRTKHIQAGKHKTLASDTSLQPMDSDQDVQLEVASDLPTDNHHPSSPPPFQPEVAYNPPNNNHNPSSPLLQPEVDFHHEQLDAEEVLASTNFHPFLNGMI
jgi:hypothetical protein